MLPISMSPIHFTAHQNEMNMAKELVNEMLQSGELFWEKLTSRGNEDPQLYENIKVVILNEYPEKKAILRQIKTHLSFMLTPSEASGIINKHSDRKHLRMVQIADYILALSYTFSTLEQAERYFNSRKTCYMEAVALRKELIMLQNRVANAAPRDIRHEGKWNQVYHDSFRAEQKLREFKKDGDLKKLPYWRHLHLLNNVALHSLLKVYQPNSLKAKNAYCESIRTYFGSQIKPEYWRVLAGENGAIPILSYYGLEFRKDDGTSCCQDELFPLSTSNCPGMHFGYSLEFPTIADFENEIRADLNTSSLPPPIYAGETQRIALTEKEMKMRILFEGDFGRWKELSETACGFAVREFIAWNHWDTIGIRENEVVFFQMTPGSEVIEGKLLIKDVLVGFTFRLTTMAFQLDGLPRDSRISFFHLKHIKEHGKQASLSCKKLFKQI